MRIMSEIEFNDLMPERIFTNEEKDKLLGMMGKRDLFEYEIAMTDYERYKDIENMGRRKWRKLSILERSCYISKEDILVRESMKHDGISLLERSCYVPPKEGIKMLYKTKDEFIY